MNKRYGVLLVALLVVGGATYAGREYVRDAWEMLNARVLPKPRAFVSSGAVGGSDSAIGDQGPSFEGGVATSTNYQLVSSPMPTQKLSAPVDPLEVRGPLPDEVNLDVPFTIQSPDQKWDLPYKEACEEASVLMVSGYYAGKTGLIGIDEAKRSILEMVDYENRTFGDFVHTTAAQTARMAQEYFHIRDTKIVSIKDERDIQRLVANGYPVIVPAAGRLLRNPNFIAPGPVYHMLAVKGYTKDGLFITNDPGTRKGYNYTYSFDTIFDAAHDYHAKDILRGAKVVLVLLPNLKP